MPSNGENGKSELPGRQFPIVCIGMSAGGITPLKELFRNISPATGMAFVVIHHIRTMPTLLPKILARCTKMPVQIAQPGLMIEPNQIYILPSGQEITTADGYFSIRPRSKILGWSNVFSVFLESLIKSRHAGIAVILSGLDADGASAIRAFHHEGGVTVAQAPETAERGEMPQAAINTGQVDYVLPPEQISAQLEKTAHELASAQRAC